MDNPVLLSEAELPGWDFISEMAFKFEEFCASPPILREATALAFLKLGGGVELFFSYTTKTAAFKYYFVTEGDLKGNWKASDFSKSQVPAQAYQ